MAKKTTIEEALTAVRENGLALENVPWGTVKFN